MRKIIITLIATFLAGALALTLFLIHHADSAASDTYQQNIKVFTVKKNGQTFTVEGRKDTANIPAEAPPKYDPSDREWAGDPKIWEQLMQVVHDAFQAERDTLLYENRGRSQELKDNLNRYFSAASGELQKRQHTIDVEIQSAAAGVGRSESTITKMDYKGISVQGDKATVVVDIYSETYYQDYNNNRDEGGGSNAEQHTVTLELDNSKWLITKDLWVFLPGYEP